MGRSMSGPDLRSIFLRIDTIIVSVGLLVACAAIAYVFLKYL